MTNEGKSRLIKKKRERTQINKIKNKIGGIITNTTNFQRIIRGHYEQLYTNKLDNLEEIEKFFETYNILRLSQLLTSDIRNRDFWLPQAYVDGEEFEEGCWKVQTSSYNHVEGMWYTNMMTIVNSAC